MLATLGGTLALLVGLIWLLLPLLATEMSRPRDSVWGAVVLLLGLVLVTSAERLTGSPMLAVLCGGLVTARLGGEVVLSRWRQLDPEEKRRLGSSERWTTSLQQLIASLVRLLEMGGGIVKGLGSWIAERRRPSTTTKRWVRPEPDADAVPPTAPTASGDTAAGESRGADTENVPGAPEVGKEASVDVVIAPAPEQGGAADQAHKAEEADQEEAREVASEQAAGAGAAGRDPMDPDPVEKTADSGIERPGDEAAGGQGPAPVVVSHFGEIDRLIAEAVPEAEAELETEAGASDEVSTPDDQPTGGEDVEQDTSDRQATAEVEEKAREEADTPDREAG